MFRVADYFRLFDTHYSLAHILSEFFLIAVDANLGLTLPSSKEITTWD